MPDLDIELVPVGFWALAVLIVIFIIWARDRWVRLTLGSALLFSSYLALQFSWDIWHEDMRGYSGTAPGPAVLAFLFGPAGFISGVVAIVLLATSWRVVLTRFVALAAVPCLVTMAYHVHEGAKVTQVAEQRESEWKRSHDAMERSIRGSLWAQQNRLMDSEDCSQNPSNYPQFERDTDFAAGCQAGVRDNRRMEGMAWAARRGPAANDDCEPKASEVALPEGIEACKENARQARKKLGADWARTQHLTSEDDCPGRFGDASPEFGQGCVDYLRTTRATGANWARTHHISTLADCKLAPRELQQQPMFGLGCEDAARAEGD